MPEIAEYVYYLSEGAVMRQKAPGGMTEPIEVWFKNVQKWSPYNDFWDFWHTANEISEEEAVQLMKPTSES